MITYTPTPDYYNNYIAHHGVKGMKWGIRNDPIRTHRKKGSIKKKKKITYKGYSNKQYQKYKNQGMDDMQAIKAAKDRRKKTIRNIAIGAAALTLTAIAAKKMYDSGFNLKGMSQREVFEKRAAKIAEKTNYKNFKFKNRRDYEAAKLSAAKTEFMKAISKGNQGKFEDFYKWVDEDTIKRYAKSYFQGDSRYKKYYRK